jgi:hypothetical protein
LHKARAASSASPAPLQISWTLQGLSRASCIPVGTLREEVRSGRLAARRNGRRVLISATSFDDWFNTLPPAVTTCRIGDHLDRATQQPSIISDDDWLDRIAELRCDHDHEHISDDGDEPLSGCDE